MKSLLVIRSPLFRRKKFLGIFKFKKKILGPIFIERHNNQLFGRKIRILSSSFSRSKRTANSISDYLQLDRKESIRINSSIQDLDAEGCIDILNQTEPSIDTVVLIAPGVIISTLYLHLTGKRRILPFGQTELVKFDVSKWSDLTNNEIKAGKIRILKNV